MRLGVITEMVLIMLTTTNAWTEAFQKQFRKEIFFAISINTGEVTTPFYYGLPGLFYFKNFWPPFVKSPNSQKPMILSFSKKNSLVLSVCSSLAMQTPFQSIIRYWISPIFISCLICRVCFWLVAKAIKYSVALHMHCPSIFSIS